MSEATHIEPTHICDHCGPTTLLDRTKLRERGQIRRLSLLETLIAAAVTFVLCPAIPLLPLYIIASYVFDWSTGRAVETVTGMVFSPRCATCVRLHPTPIPPETPHAQR